jgi:hypothetical protein
MSGYSVGRRIIAIGTRSVRRWRMSLLALAMSYVVGTPGHFTAQGRPIDFTYMSVPRGCRKGLPKLKRLCTKTRDQQKYHLQVAFGDFNLDGLEDVVIRYMSSTECGSRGCSTEVYYANTDGVFRLVLNNLNTDGRVIKCRTRGRSGVAFPDSGPRHVCFGLQ